MLLLIDLATEFETVLHQFYLRGIGKGIRWTHPFFFQGLEGSASGISQQVYSGQIEVPEYWGRVEARRIPVAELSFDQAEGGVVW